MTIKQFLGVAISFLILGFILAYSGCKRVEIKQGEPITHVHIEIDSVIVPVPVDRIQTVVKYVNTPPIVMNHTDTVEALDDYAKMFIYSRNFRDSAVQFNWNDTVTKNTIKQADFSYKILKHVSISTTTITPQIKPRNALYIGLGVLGNKSTFGAEPMLQYVTTSGKMFGAGFDVINKTVMLDALIKIHIEK